MFLPTTTEEMRRLGWDRPDVIIVTGDAYIDSPYSGTALIGQILMDKGFRTAVLSQPNVHDSKAFQIFGEPRLYWGVNAGCVDSMVANYTAIGKKRRNDDNTPGGVNNRRPDRAVIVYSNAIRAAYRPARPIVIGGIEASLRRVAHYDFWSDTIRRPIICDAKADVLVYGMGERVMVALAEAIRDGRDWRGMRGTCHWGLAPAGAVELPAYEAVAERSPVGKTAFLKAYQLFVANQDPLQAKTIVQKIDTRYLVHNPPALPLETAELDAVYNLHYMLDAPPSVRVQGKVRALDTIRFAVTTHRGCYGNCRFCAIAAHQGRRIVSRSADSVVEEVKRMTLHPAFRGTIADVGGPTANMYGIDCARKRKQGACTDRECLFPQICPALKPDHGAQRALLSRLRAIPGVKHVFVASGIRPDLVVADSHNGCGYVDDIARYHVSGQLKLAPEHVCKHVLTAMGKPSVDSLLVFKRRFDKTSRAIGRKQFLTYYFIAAHPGCTENDMRELKHFVTRELQLNPEQVQIFTPTPLTAATTMYYTGLDPRTGKPIYVARGLKEKQRQKDLLTNLSRYIRKGKR